MKPIKLPNTDSIEELARFWDAHDLTDFEDELEEVTEPVFVRPTQPTLHFSLTWQELEQIRRIAGEKGIDSATLVHEWVVEKLQAA